MRRTTLLILLLFPLGLAAQSLVVRGLLQDSKTLEPLEYATASLLRADTIVGRSAVADGQGRFSLEAPGPGKYALRLSYVGYQPRTMNLEWPAGKDTLDVGVLGLVSEDYKIGVATVTATAAKVEQKGDTTMFNAAAYRVPEGSTLEALIKQLPGVEVGDDGTVTYNGKQITEFLINGKDFFKGDTQVAMKNLPTNLVSKIKAYEKKSDYTEQTGIDDGEETSVLDISTKRALNESWVTNADLAYGTENRYAERIFISRFTDKSYVSAYANLNNVNDRGFGGPRGFGGGDGGLVSTKNGGLSFSWDNGRKRNEAGRFEVGGHVRAAYRSTDVLTTSASETFLSSGAGSSFSNSRNQSYDKKVSLDGHFRLRWNPDSLTSIMMRPNFSYSSSKNSGDSRSATFDDDPYSVEGVDDPLTADADDEALKEITVNRNTRRSLSDDKTYSFGTSLNLTRRLSALGRNVNFRGNVNYSESEGNAFSLSEIRYYNGTRDDSRTNQYTFTPSKNFNYNLRLGYVEPLGANWFAEARYEFGYRYQDRDRTLRTFDYDNYGDQVPPLGYKPTEADYLMWVRDENNSQYATYRTFNQVANVGVRYNSETVRFNAGVDFQPQTTKLDYERPGQHLDTLITRHVFHVAPTVRLRYSFSKTNRLDINYRGSSSEPSMTNLLAVVDDSDPLNISMGNPGLKPSWTNSLRAIYQGYNADLQRGIMGGVDFQQTSNSISNRMVYDQTTGVRYTRPENINGNWNASGRFMFNTPLDYEKLFTVTTFTHVSYRNQVGYVSVTGDGARTARTMAAPAHDYDYYMGIFDASASRKSTARTLGVSEDLTLSYRRDWYDFSVFGRVNYDHSRATARENANLDTWQYAYGVRGNLTFNWGMSFSTDLRVNSRRGYADASMNTNEVLWNVQLSQSFLRDRTATISLQAYDLLRQQSSVSRTISALQRSDSWSNAIHSYFMVHFIYRLNIFGGKRGGESASGGRASGERRGQGPRGMGGGMPPMMPMMR